MKNTFTTLLLLTIFFTQAQVGIGVSTASMATSAQLEVASTTKGFLPPRMTESQRNLIVSPEQGLMIYCTDCGANGEPEYYNGIAWVNLLGTAASASTATSGTATEAFSFVYSNNTSVWTTQKFDGTAWTNVAANPENNSGSRIGKIGNEYFAGFYNSNANTYSVHAFNGSTWRSVTTSGTAPPYFYGASLGVYNNKIYYHASNGSGYSTYTFDGTTWAVASTLGTPPSDGIGYMTNTHNIGEFNNKSYYSNSSWNGSSSSYSLYTFDGATWTNNVSPINYYYQFIGQLGNISYLYYHNGSGYSYATFDGTTFSDFTPTGLPSVAVAEPYNLFFLGVINNKMHVVYYDNSGGKTQYTFDGNTFTSLSIASPGNYFGGLDNFFLGGNLK
jgi:hypothetical protein